MMNLHSTLAGHTAWEVLTPAGVVVAAGERHNLVTNAGLDEFATQTTPFTSFRGTLRVGTGSGTPTATKTSLTAEIASAASSSNGGFGAEESVSYTRAGDNSAIICTSKIVRVASFTAAHNVTEYGLSSGSSGFLSITELFRDAQGNPVAVPVQNGYQLKITHTLTVTLPTVPQASSLDLGTGNIQTLNTFTVSANGRENNAFETFAPGKSSATTVQAFTAADAGNPFSSAAIMVLTANYTLAPYVSGTYRRVKSFAATPSEGNGDHYGYRMTSGGYGDGFKVAFQNGGKVTKNNTQKLTLDFTVSWGRV